MWSRESRRRWIAVLPALVVPGGASLFYFVWFSDSTLARGLYSATKAFTLLWPVVATVWILRQRLPRPKPGWHHWRALPAGLITGGTIVALLFGILQTPVGEVIRSGVPAIRAKAGLFGFLEHYWLLAVLLSTLHSLLEEYYWRWFVYGGLRELLPGTAAHIVAGVAFSGHHVVVTGQYFGWGWGLFLGACTGVGGVIWSLLYARQGTLAGAWLSHFLVDMGLMVVGYRLLFPAN